MKRLSLLPLLMAGALIAVPAAHAADHAKAASKGDAAKGQAIGSTVCAACHGADGNSTGPANPKLAAQHPEYLFKQMKDFKAADGGQPNRVDPVMNGMIAAFDEEQMRDLAAYFATQKLNGEQAKSRETIEAGQKLYRAGDAAKGLPACAACHGPAGAGMPAQFPRIAGQFADYTEKQLKAFRDGARANDPNKMMRMVALKMTDAEIKAVADYIAGLR
ncbi:MAG: cytochrome c4 [Sterolibacteriaceae bacterium MAG5]|nr:cytochrome c4 [Candidatus Nitricoxidireducens bremensis]